MSHFELGDIGLSAPRISDQAPPATEEVAAEPIAETQVDTPAQEQETNTTSDTTQAQEQAPTTTEPASQPEAEGAAPTEEPLAEDQELGFFTDASAADFDLEPAATETAPLANTPDYSAFMQSFSQRMGRSEAFESMDQVYEAVSAAQQAQQAMDTLGLTPEVIEAINNDYISREEAIRLTTPVDLYKGDDEGAIHDMLLEEDPDMTADEIQEVIEDMTPSQKKLAARQYRREIRQKREGLANSMRQKLQNRQQQRELQQKRHLEARNQLRQGVQQTLSGLKEIPGTNVPVTPEMRNVLSAALTEPQKLTRYLFGGNPSQPDYQGAVRKISAMIYGATIMKNQANTAKNEATREIIEGASNITLGNGSGKAVTGQGQKNIYQAAQAGAQKVRNSLFGN